MSGTLSPERRWRRHSRQFRVVAIAVAAVPIAISTSHSLRAANVTWDAGFGNTFTWSQPGNWSPDAEPTINDDVISVDGAEKCEHDLAQQRRVCEVAVVSE